MIRFMLIMLVGVLYFVGISVGCADIVPTENIKPDDAHMQAVNQALDNAESFRNNLKAVSSVIVPKKNEFEFSSETYWAKFDEPKVFSQKGFLSGYNARYAHRFSTDPKSMINMFSLQGQWADGKFKQAPYVGYSGIKDSTFDVRGVVGKDFRPAPYVRTTGYLGFGYRYLKDNSDGLSAVIGDYTLLGYKRFSHYDYLPFGADIIYQSDPRYSLESNLEYDYVVHGWQVSKLGVVPGYNTLVVDQGNGLGLRGSLRLNIYSKYFTLFAEGFYRYWNIPQSKSKPDPTDPIVALNEPRNNTQEYGLRLGLQL